MTHFPVNKFAKLKTPFYYYDMELLKQTLFAVKEESLKYGFKVHYAVKANANDRILEEIRESGFGADCVSGYEVQKVLDCGFPPQGIVYAGVGKADWEIELGLDNHIACFNVESLPELEIINQIAGQKGVKARVALRINPNVNPNTHHFITTGLEENKFGINFWELGEVTSRLPGLTNIVFEGLHFHIGSQITDMGSFKELCLRVNEVQDWFIERKLFPRVLNMGGGLGIDYETPRENPVPDFATYFKVFNDFLKVLPGQEVHFELGRSLVAQAGTLISRVLYVKEGVNTKFAILDAGMTDLIRPALYQAYHSIENISNLNNREKYDVVGPICESSDCFGKAILLPEMQRGNFIAILSAGAYGEVMVSHYNLREAPKAYYSDSLQNS